MYLMGCEIESCSVGDQSLAARINWYKGTDRRHPSSEGSGPRLFRLRFRPPFCCIWACNCSSVQLSVEATCNVARAGSLTTAQGAKAEPDIKITRWNSFPAYKNRIHKCIRYINCIHFPILKEMLLLEALIETVFLQNCAVQKCIRYIDFTLKIDFI